MDPRPKGSKCQVAILLLALVLVGCTSTRLEPLPNTRIEADPFFAAIINEYLRTHPNVPSHAKIRLVVSPELRKQFETRNARTPGAPWGLTGLHDDTWKLLKESNRGDVLTIAVTTTTRSEDKVLVQLQIMQGDRREYLDYSLKEDGNGKWKVISIYLTVFS